jgi:hypothetical protein
MLAAELAALIATGLALAGAWPQLRRLARTGDTNGVSLANATLAIGSELGWLSYTLHGSLWSAAPESALMALTHVLLAVVLVRAGVPLARPLAAAVAWSAILVAATTIGGWVLLGAMLPIAYGVQVAPAVWCAYRTHSPSGIAVGTWLLILVECVLWGVYGGVQHDPALTMLAALGGSSSLAIVVRVLATRDRTAPLWTPMWVAAASESLR